MHFRRKLPFKRTLRYEPVRVPKLLPHRATRDTVARNLRRLLDAAEMSVTVLATKSGVMRSVCYTVLNASVGVTVDVLGRLADALDVHVSEFFREKK